MERRNPIFKGVTRFLPAILIMGIIFLLSGTPSTKLPDFGGLDTLAKKGSHMFGYALLSLSYLYAIGKRDWKYFVISLCLTILYAITDEFHQSFTPGRNSTWTDVGIDTIGAMIGLISWRYISLIHRIIKLAE
jgi:VanZ family protein